MSTAETTIDHSRLPLEQAGRASRRAHAAVASSSFNGWVDTVEARHPSGEVYIGTARLLGDENEPLARKDWADLMIATGDPSRWWATGSESEAGA